MSVRQPEQSPIETVVHAMSALGDDGLFVVHDQRDVTDGACRGLKVTADRPGDRLEVPVAVQRIEQVAVLAHRIDFVGRRIRAAVAF